MAAVKLSLVISVEETAFDAVAIRSSLQDGIKMAAELGYEGVELALRDPARIDATAVANALRASRLQLPAIGTGQAYLKEGLSLTHPDEGPRTKAIERMESHIRLARQFGSMVIVGLLRGRTQGDRPGADARLDSSLERILPLAEREGVRVLFEPINRYETDYLPTIEDVLAMIGRHRSPVLGILADTFHMNIEEGSMDAALRRAGSRLQHIHAADSNRRAPGWGHLDFPGFVRILREIGYDGYLSAEILPHPDPLAAARQTVDYLRPLIRMA